MDSASSTANIATKSCAARACATLVFPVLLLLTVFFFTRALFGPLAAGIAALLTLFEPNLTAFGPLGPDRRRDSQYYFARRRARVELCPQARLAFACSVLGCRSWVSAWRPSIPPRSCRLSCSRNSASILGFAGAIRCARRLRKARRRAGSRACIIAVIVLWGTYQFRFNALPGDIPRRSSHRQRAPSRRRNEFSRPGEWCSLAARTSSVARVLPRRTCLCAGHMPRDLPISSARNWPKVSGTTSRSRSPSRRRFPC